jgi:hypothetical protein
MTSRRALSIFIAVLWAACDARSPLNTPAAGESTGKTGAAGGPAGGQPGRVGGSGGGAGTDIVGGDTAELTVLASGQRSPFNIALDANAVYWSNWGSRGGTADVSVAKVSIHGGAVTPLATGLAGASGVGLDGTSVYFVAASSNSFGLMSVPLTGGRPRPLATGFTNDPIAIGLTRVFGSGSLSGVDFTVLSAPLGGGTATPVVPASSLQQTFTTYGIAVDGSSVYWITFTDPALVMEAPLDSGAPTTLAKAPGGGRGLAVDAKYVYFGTGTVLMKVPLTGGTPTMLAPVAGIGIAIDDTSVYVTDDYINGPGATGTVKKVSKAGGEPTTLATGLERPWGIAVDATSVYWSNGGSQSDATGTIMKLTPK